MQNANEQQRNEKKKKNWKIPAAFYNAFMKTMNIFGAVALPKPGFLLVFCVIGITQQKTEMLFVIEKPREISIYGKKRVYF